MAIKILLGGSPCTHWSIAQKNNRETKAEGIGWELFKNYLIAKDKFQPDIFLYENNKSAAQAIKDQIATELGVGTDPNARFTYINSSLVSAQNRQRFYVTNFGDISQPEDRGILLKDILEPGAICDQLDRDKTRTITAGYQTCSQRDLRMDIETDGFMGKQGAIEPVNITEDGKAQCVRATCYKDGIRNLVANDCNRRTCIAEPVGATRDGKSCCIKAQYQSSAVSNFITNGKFNASGVAEPVRVGCYPSPDGTIKNSQAMRLYSTDGKSVNLTANGGGLGAKTGLYAIPITEVESKPTKSIRVGCLPSPDGTLKNTQGKRIYSPEGKSVCIAAGASGGNTDVSSSSTGLYAIPVEFENGIPTKATSCADGKTYTVYEVKDGQITIKGKQYPIKLNDGYYIIRKLSVTECARLQTMPDDYCKAVSDSQAYKGLGNGWTAEVIIHILNHALKDVPRDEELIVLSMYDGIGTGMYCLKKMGFTNIKYYAYEKDPYPIKIAMDNHPEIIQCGDAFAVRNEDWRLE